MTYRDGAEVLTLDSPIVSGQISGDEATRAFVADLLDVMGDVRALWVFGNESGTTEGDRGGDGRTLTWQQDVGTFDSPPGRLGSGLVVRFNGTAGGTEFGQTPAADSLSFTDGKRDQPFSIVALVRFRDATLSTIASRWDQGGAGRQYTLDTDVNGLLQIRLFDTANNAIIGRETSVSLDPGGTSADITKIAFSPDFANDGTVFLASDEGVFKSTESGAAFASVNASFIGTPISVAVSPDFANDGTLIVATNDVFIARLYRSTDGGTSWTLVLGPLDGRPFTPNCLAFSPNFADDDTIFVCARFGGVWRSTDGGDAWVRTANGTNGLGQGVTTTIKVSTNYAVDSTVFVGLSFDAGIAEAERGFFSSSDGGDTWSRLSAFAFESSSMNDISVSPDFANDNTVFVVTEFDIWRSTDSGVTWSSVQQALVGAGIAISPDYANDDTAFAMFGNGPYRTIDEGLTWSFITDDGVPPEVGKSIAVSPHYAVDSTVFAGTDRGLFRSLDGGETWSTVLTRGQFMLITMVSDGSGSLSGLSLFKNIARVDGADITTGSGYSAMGDINTPINVGASLVAGSSLLVMNGDMAFVGMAGKMLTLEDIAVIAELASGFYGVDL